MAAASRAGRVGRDHRLRRGRHARLPRLGDARHRGQRAPGLVLATPTSTRPRAGWSRSSAASAPRCSSPTATTSRGTRTPTTCGCTTSRCWPSTGPVTPAGTPKLASPFAAVKLYYTVWCRQPHAGDPRGAAAPDGRVAVRREVVRAPRHGPTHHHQGSTSPTTCRPGSESLRAHATQVEPGRGVVVRALRRRAGRGVSVRGLDPGQVAVGPIPDPRARSRTTCSPACGVAGRLVSASACSTASPSGRRTRSSSGPTTPSVVVTIGQADLGLDPTVAYMQGKLKSTGPTGQLFDLLQVGRGGGGARRHRCISALSSR